MFEIDNEKEKRYKKAFSFNEGGQYEKYILEIQKLANEGHHDAQMSLGLAYYQGKEPLKKDLHLSLQWHKKALAGGNPVNFFWLAILYDPEFDIDQRGLSFKDKKKSNHFYFKALKGYEKKAENGDVTAMYSVAEMYAGGVTKDTDKSKYWINLWRKNQKVTGL